MTTNKPTKRAVHSVRDLDVYKLAFDCAMRIFEMTKSFPEDEKYSLVDQMRRSSRSVCTSLAEGWRKRKYRAAFVHKLTESEQEAAETQTWLDFSLKCGYIVEETFDDLFNRYEHVFAMLVNMERKADSFCKGNAVASEGT